MFSIRISLLASIFLTAFLPFPVNNESINGKNIEVNYQAKVNLIGTTNINTFACYSPQVDNSMWIKMKRAERNGQFEFDHPVLKIPVNDLDCGGKVINKDLQETLHAKEYPYIQIRLESANLKDRRASAKEAMALTCISIGSTERCMDIPVTINEVKQNQYQFCGSVPLSMTEFGLIPPQALMGMIKARDEIVVSFDMMISLVDESK